MVELSYWITPNLWYTLQFRMKFLSRKNDIYIYILYILIHKSSNPTCLFNFLLFFSLLLIWLHSLNCHQVFKNWLSFGYHAYHPHPKQISLSTFFFSIYFILWFMILFSLNLLTQLTNHYNTLILNLKFIYLMVAFACSDFDIINFYYTNVSFYM